MIFKRAVLFFIALIIVIAFFKSDFYNTWFNTKILQMQDPDSYTGVEDVPAVYDRVTDMIGKQAERMSVRERMEMRYGMSYYISEAVDSILKANKVKDPYILFPPNAYLKEGLHYNDFNVPEPAIFYYFTGLQEVWANSPEVQKTNWTVIIESLKNKDYLQQIIAEGQKIIPLYNGNGIVIALIQVTDKQQLGLILDHYKNYNAEL